MPVTSTTAHYSVQFNGQQFGPHSREEIASMLAAGMIDESALLWSEGWPGWIPVSNVVRPQTASEEASPAPVSRTPEYSAEVWERRRRNVRRYRDRVGRRSYVFQLILTGWTILYVGWITTTALSAVANAPGSSSGLSSSSSPLSRVSALDFSAGFLSGWICLGAGWGVVGLPVGIAAVATMKED